MGILSGICIYPVKSMRRIELESSEVTLRGLENDRLWVVTDADRKALTQRDHHELATFRVEVFGNQLQIRHRDLGLALFSIPKHTPELVKVWNDEVLAVNAGPMVTQWISKALNRPAHLYYMPTDSQRQIDLNFGKENEYVSFADGYPILLANEASCLDLNCLVPMVRFRANLIVSGFNAWEEERWQRVKIGDMEFRAVKPCARCIVTTIDQETGERNGTEPLTTLAKRIDANGKVNFGMNLIPDSTGSVSLGDPVIPL